MHRIVSMAGGLSLAALWWAAPAAAAPFPVVGAELAPQSLVTEVVVVRRGYAARGPRGGVVAGRGTVVRPPYGRPAAGRAVVVAPGWRRPANYWWRPGTAIAAGAAVGVVAAGAAAAYAGSPPAPNQCWYYTNTQKTQGFWDVCP